jgi:hypothetical protein
MADPVIAGALGWVLQRMLDKGIDLLLDGAPGRVERPRPPPPATAPAVVTPRRHDLSVVHDVRRTTFVLPQVLPGQGEPGPAVPVADGVARAVRRAPA